MKETKAVREALDKAAAEGRVTERNRKPTEALPEKPLSEKAFFWRVVGHAEDHGWKWYHVYDSRRSNPGFPDLVLWRERIVYTELKKEDGKVSEDQERVLRELKAAGAEVHVWRPSDWPEIERILE